MARARFATTAPPPAPAPTTGAGVDARPVVGSDVLLLAPDLDAAKALVRLLEAAGLQTDRGRGAEDAAFAVASLPLPQLVLVAVDDMLERARIRRALATDHRWSAIPVVEVGHGALDVALLVGCIAGHRLADAALR